MLDNKTVMNVKILSECGFDEAMLAIAMNKKKYDRDMYPVSKKLAVAGSGHSKFLEFLHVYIDYTTTRSIHQQIDTYRVGVTKSSESTHHMLIEDVLESCINRKTITDKLAEMCFIVNKEKCVDGLVPINNTALIIAKLNTIINESIKANNTMINIDTIFDNHSEMNTLICEYMNKYFVCSEVCSDGSLPISTETAKTIMHILLNEFNIDYDHYYSMFEGGSEAITKDMVDKMVELAMTLEEDRYGKLHKLKRMLPEGFLQRRIMSANYMVLKHMIDQRFTDQFDAWRIFCREILLQVKHPEYFQDIFDKYNVTLEDLQKNLWNGKPYIVGY